MASTLPASLPPRLLTREQAAEYCGVSVDAFEARCPVRPHQWGRRKLYDRKLLDLTLDQWSGIRASSSDDEPENEALRRVRAGEVR
jgi:hypothetical protein